MNEQLRMFEQLADDYANKICFDSKGNLIPELNWSEQFLIKFAELVTYYEREACAKLAEDFVETKKGWHTGDLLAAIRARGEKE